MVKSLALILRGFDCFLALVSFFGKKYKFVMHKSFFLKTWNPMTRLTQVLLSCLPILLTLHLQAQQAEPTPPPATEKFSSPVIADEMTVNPEQNKMWRTGQAKYSAKPKSMWELGIHGGSSFVSGDVDAAFPAGYGFGLHVRKL